MFQKTISMQQFAACVRKQISFQNGKCGHRKDMYYTAYNNEMGLATDTWGMIVFIYCGDRLGFTDDQMRHELKIQPSMYDVIKQAVPYTTTSKCDNPMLYKVVTTKIGLVKNSIFYAHGIKISD